MCEIVSAATMAATFGEGAGALTAMQAIGALGTVISTVGAVGSMRGQSAAAGYDAQQSENNRIIAEQNAQDAINRGRVEQEAKDRETRLRIGAITANAGSANVLIDEGSSVSGLLEDTASFGRLDSLTIAANADREARGYRIAANNAAAARDIASMRQDNIESSAPWTIGGNLLAGAASVAEMNYRGSKRYRQSMLA